MNAITSITPAEHSGSTVVSWVAHWWLLLILLLAIAGFSAFRSDMLSTGNVVTVLQSASFLSIMVLGLTWVTAAGKLDVSFVQIASLANMAAAGLLAAGFNWWIAAVVGLLVGPIVGFLNGILIGVIRLPSLIVTIATGGVCGSAAAAIGLGTSISINDAGVLGHLLGISFGYVPLIAIVTVALYFVAWWCQERLAVGRYVYAMAQNEEAVLESGVPTGRLIVILYVVTGTLAAAAGVLLAARLSSGQPILGASYFIDGFTAVLVGGMMIRLGKPNVIGTGVAALLLAVLVSGGALLGWPDYQQEVLKGVLLIVGVAVSVYMGRRSQPLLRGNSDH